MLAKAFSRPYGPRLDTAPPSTEVLGEVHGPLRGRARAWRQKVSDIDHKRRPYGYPLLATDGMNKAKVLARIVFLLAALVYLAEVTVHGFAAWLLDSRQPKNVELAAKLDPGNPAVWTARGAHLLFSEQGFQPEKAVEAYLHAATLNPLDVRNWDGLADAYFQLHEPRKMEAALRAAALDRKSVV